MVLKERIDLMHRLGQYFIADNETWQNTKQRAYAQNPWFLPEYIDIAVKHIATVFLQPEALNDWLLPYAAFKVESSEPEIGIVMAGNIPLVGFHDFLAVFLSGCRQRIKLSKKDEVLWQHIVRLLIEWSPQVESLVSFSEQLKGCDAYIATGSNNSARYFEYYFAKYPHIIRRNRSSLAVLTGNETPEMLEALCDDICLYFGLGCRNVTQLLVSENYDFESLQKAIKKYEHHLDSARYKNNYDYQLALVLLNKVSYQDFCPILLVPSDSLFAPISVLHYKTYKNKQELTEMFPSNEALQCVMALPESLPVGQLAHSFGTAQFPVLNDYADQVNTLSFLETLKIS